MTIILVRHAEPVPPGVHAPSRVDHAFWAAMPMPAVYAITDGAVSGPGLDPPVALIPPSSRRSRAAS